jgi:hypothetical protein
LLSLPLLIKKLVVHHDIFEVACKGFQESLNPFSFLFLLTACFQCVNYDHGHVFLGDIVLEKELLHGMKLFFEVEGCTIVRGNACGTKGIPEEGVDQAKGLFVLDKLEQALS